MGAPTARREMVAKMQSAVRPRRFPGRRAWLHRRGTEFGARSDRCGNTPAQRKDQHRPPSFVCTYPKRRARSGRRRSQCRRHRNRSEVARRDKTMYLYFLAAWQGARNPGPVLRLRGGGVRLVWMNHSAVAIAGAQLVDITPRAIDDDAVRAADLDSV